jgi:hypothetical protein
MNRRNAGNQVSHGEVENCQYQSVVRVAGQSPLVKDINHDDSEDKDFDDDSGENDNKRACLLHY